MDDVEPEFARLRRAAYSSTGTAEDLRRLADYEARRAQPVVVAPAEVDPDPQPTTFDADALPDPVNPPTPTRPAHRVRPLVLAAAGGAIVGSLVTAGVVAATRVEPSAWSGTSSLEVFDRVDTPRDDPDGLAVPLEDVLAGVLNQRAIVDDFALRWIGAPGGFATYAVRWTFDGATTVCVLVESSRDAVTACVPESAFRQGGIRLSAFGMDLRWGPTGAEVWANSSG